MRSLTLSDAVNVLYIFVNHYHFINYDIKYLMKKFFNFGIKTLQQ